MWPYYSGMPTAAEEVRVGRIKAAGPASLADLRNSMWTSRQSVKYLAGVVRGSSNNGVRRAALQAMHLYRSRCRTAAMALRLRASADCTERTA